MSQPSAQQFSYPTPAPRIHLRKEAAKETCHGTACQGFHSSSTPSLSPQAPAVLGCKRTLLPDVVPRWPLIGRSTRTISCPVHRDKSSPARSRSTRPGEDAGESSTSPRGLGNPSHGGGIFAAPNPSRRSRAPANRACRNRVCLGTLGILQCRVVLALTQDRGDCPSVSNRPLPWGPFYL